MNDLMTLSQFVNWIDSMTSLELYKQFPRTFHSIENIGTPVQIANNMVANDAITWRLVKEYNKFLQRKLTISMIEGDSAIFIGNKGDVSLFYRDKYVNGEIVFRNSNKTLKRLETSIVSDLCGLNIKTTKPIFNSNGYIAL